MMRRTFFVGVLAALAAAVSSSPDASLRGSDKASCYCPHDMCLVNINGVGCMCRPPGHRVLQELHMNQTTTLPTDVPQDK